MPAPPAKTEISDAYPSPSNATARTGFGKLWETLFGTSGLLGSTGNPAEALVALGANGRYAGYAALTTNTTLTATAAGKLHNIGASSLTITLPAGSAMKVGDEIHFNTSVSFTIARAGSDTINGPAGTGLTAAVMYGNCSIAWNGSLWIIMHGGDQHVLGTIGQFRFPGGLMVKWGSTVSTLSGSVATVTFATAFTSSISTVLVSNGDTTSTTIMPGVRSYNTSGFVVEYPAGGSSAVRTHWIAIGV